jgi:hypothetical protein
VRSRRGRIVGAIAAIGVTAGLPLATTTPVRAARAPSGDRVGVSATAVRVAGIVGTDAASTGADLGAQARFARAARRRVAGRTVEYLRTTPAPDAATADAAAAELSGEAFAVVPAVGPAVGAAALGRDGVPFFGVGDTADWYTNRTGFGVVGVAVNERTRVAASPLGVQLAWVLGDTDDAVVVVHDDDPAGAVRAEQARRSLRRAGFGAVSVTPVAPDAAPTVPSDAGVVVLLTGATASARIAGQLAASGSTATVVVGPEFYVPGAPGAAAGLTVLVPVAPFEEVTAGNRRLAADVEAFAPGTVLTPAIARGYWSADLFVRALERTGRRLTRARLLEELNGDDFSYEVPGTVGRSVWPEMHTQPVPCGSLVQSDGTQYLVVAPYRCAPPR